MSVLLCPPAIAEGADMNLMTRLQVRRERQEFWPRSARMGYRVDDSFLAELEALEWESDT